VSGQSRQLILGRRLPVFPNQRTSRDRADWSVQSVLHHPGIQECPGELQQPLVLDALGDLAHQFVMIDSIEKFFQVEIDHPSVTLRNILLRLSHGDAPTDAVGTHSCIGRTLDSIAFAEPASPLAG
jgi:hypothetical protein